VRELLEARCIQTFVDLLQQPGSPELLHPDMTVSIPTSLPPMEALLVADLPRVPEGQYEPKWDGFRRLAFTDGATIETRPKSGQPLDRYIPEIVSAATRRL